MPGRKDFDEVTRQLTELRCEVRALSRRVQTQEQATRATISEGTRTVSKSDAEANEQRKTADEENEQPDYAKDIAASTEKMIKAAN